jgi:hypothetical protein
VFVLSCVGRGLGAGLIPRPRSPTKCLKGSISKKKKNPTPAKGIRRKKKEEEEQEDLQVHYCVRNSEPEELSPHLPILFL